MKYTRVSFICNPSSEAVKDVLAAMLGGIGFDAFMDGETTMEAYIPSSFFSPTSVDQVLANFPIEATILYSAEEMEDRNWNEEWEKNYFQPISIDNRLCIHSSFHRLDDEYRYRILIDPKMSFGTGHHETTRLMLEELLEMDLSNKVVLDMGCGTAVLSILASMRGASEVTAIDIDEWAYSNALENVRLNGTRNIRVIQGGVERLEEHRSYDVILANINRNILLRDMPYYKAALNQGGTLIISGFYRADIPSLRAKAEEIGLIYLGMFEKKKWAAVSFCNQ